MGLIHFFRARPFSGPRNDAGAVPFGQLTVKGFRAVETNGPLVGNGRTVFFGFWIIKRDVRPQGIVVVADPAHLQRLGDNEVKVEQSTAVNALPSKNKGAVAELREFFAQFIAHLNHRRRVV